MYYYCHHVTKGSVTAVLPTATLIPKDWPLIVLSLKDCFYPIHIQPDDKMRFTFSVPSLNRNELQLWLWIEWITSKYEKLPDVMLILCRKVLELWGGPFLRLILFLYICWYPDSDLQRGRATIIYDMTQDSLHKYGLSMEPESVTGSDTVNIWEN